MRYFRDFVVSMGGALLVLGLLIQYVSSAAEPMILPRLMRVVREVGLVFVAGYLFTSFAQTLFRAVRYRLILATSRGELPGIGHLFLVSLARNMFVDMLPARLGELSFIAMLNKGFRVGADRCVAALSISFVFDFIALLCLLFPLVGYQLVTSSLQAWLLVVVFVLFVVCFCFLFFLFFVFVRAGALFANWSRFCPSFQLGVCKVIDEDSSALSATSKRRRSSLSARRYSRTCLSFRR